LEQIAEARRLKIATIIDHCEKIKEKEPARDFSTLAKDVPAGKLIQLKAALRKCKDADGKFLLKPAKELLGDDADYDELRLARLLL
jgi:uncharacterized protein YpbB